MPEQRWLCWHGNVILWLPRQYSWPRRSQSRCVRLLLSRYDLDSISNNKNRIPIAPLLSLFANIVDSRLALTKHYCHWLNNTCIDHWLPYKFLAKWSYSWNHNDHDIACVRHLMKEIYITENSYANVLLTHLKIDGYCAFNLGNS